MPSKIAYFLWATILAAAKKTTPAGLEVCNSESQSFASHAASLLQTQSRSWRGHSDALHSSKLSHKQAEGYSVASADKEAAQLHPVDGGLEFIHIPKNAGTTIEATALSYGVLWSNLRHVHTRQLPFPCAWYHVPRFLQEHSPQQFLDKETFCITRDPYDRLVSEYVYRLSPDHQWDKGMHHYGEHDYDVYRMLTAYPPCSADGLNHFVQQALSAYQNGVYYICGCHIIPQSDYIWDSDGSRFCQNVLRLDELPQGFDNLMKARKSPVRLGARSNEASICKNVTAKDFTTETRRMIESVYLNDFVKLNYSFRSFKSSEWTSSVTSL
mmetsp:Transcript_49454/g.90931  ORF Transcript_49454/g.90931 Transcript_49454/m.90931 type:complete len:326 (-) Transcript_49454:19-996(-)